MCPRAIAFRRRFAIAAMLVATCDARAADLFYGAEAGVFHDNNVSRAQRNQGIVSDSGLTARGNLGWAQSVGERGALSFSFDAQGTDYRRFSGLDVASLGGTLAYRTKLGLGAFVPRASVSASIAAESYGARERDGQRSRFALEAGRRLSEQWDLSGGFALDRFDASHILPPTPLFSRDVYSTKGRTLFARADYAFNERWLFNAGASVRWGDVISSSLREPEIFRSSAAVAADPVFGPDYVAYRLGGRTNSVAFGASLATSSRSSVNLGFTHAITTVQNGIDYRSTLLNASFVYSY